MSPTNGYITTSRNCRSFERSAVCCDSAPTDCNDISKAQSFLSKGLDIVIYIYYGHGILFPKKGRDDDHDREEKNGKSDDANIPGRGCSGSPEAPRRGRAGQHDGADTPSDRRVPGAPAEGEKGGAVMRGDGCIYSRGNMLWIAYSFRGETFRESAHTSDEAKARKLLKARLKQVERPNFVGPKEDKWTLADMKARIKADYDRKENRSIKTVEYCFKHLEAAFQFRRVIDITTPVVEKYTTDRLKAGAARASINRELAYLRRGFKLMLKARDISAIPAVIELLQGENVREGFLNIPDFEAAAAAVENEDTRDIVRFLYESAWRSGEAEG